MCVDDLSRWRASQELYWSTDGLCLMDSGSTVTSTKSAVGKLHTRANQSEQLTKLNVTRLASLFPASC